MKLREFLVNRRGLLLSLVAVASAVVGLQPGGGDPRVNEMLELVARALEATNENIADLEAASLDGPQTTAPEIDLAAHTALAEERRVALAQCKAANGVLQSENETYQGVRDELTRTRAELVLAREAAATAVNTCEAFNTVETESDQICFARDEWDDLVGVFDGGTGLEPVASLRD